MNAAASVCRALAAGLLAALVSGCVPIPYVIPALGYTSDSRHNLSDGVPSFIVYGQTSREEVLYALGDPDTADDQTFGYISASRRGGVGTLIVAYGGGPIPDAATQRVLFRRLVVQFDSAGRVSSAVSESKTCSIGYFNGDMFDRGVSVTSYVRCLNGPAAPVAASDAQTPADSSH
jgi:outer membrane protein assembly factor BamE (lipoprotein component of BamABCDE complex)